MEIKECEICGRFRKLEEHHLIFGRGLRQLADKYKLTIKICRECHARLHKNKKLMEWSKRRGQLEFEKTHTRDEFIKIFGRSYL